MKPVTEVEITDSASKQVRRLPLHIRESLQLWVATVRRIGIRETRKLPGYHDEPLKGARKGQRSIRLSRAYRAIYLELTTGLLMKVIEVNKHEY